jgi:hypothetical protein
MAGEIQKETAPAKRRSREFAGCRLFRYRPRVTKTVEWLDGPPRK